jgi:hypothetical protein
MSNTAEADLLKSTKYDDPASIFNITGTIGVPPSVSPLPLDKFTVGGKHTYCYLLFRDTLLPRDFLYDESRADTGLTYLKTNPDTNLLPKFFLQLGQLCLSPTTTTTSAKPSDFVIVVTQTARPSLCGTLMAQIQSSSQTATSTEKRTRRAPRAGNCLASLLHVPPFRSLLISTLYASPTKRSRY